ncbi:YdeI/OmpD-associated family protein [Reichenbachiella ulvae]|uniref:YdeI/OmpD-associated family protein n=1 Tax=Reichenbachiella ulvae TaxID=2980104 RepID=UPI00298FC427|nr:YdeI/OmpD-associated family protein [Reichenbachiella ulvae]
MNIYLQEGCGRCALGGTHDCKVHLWPEILKELRRIVWGCGLDEEVKWSVPCYTYKGKNIAIVSAFKNYASLSFFKGVLLHDSKGILEKPGENSNEGRLIKFTTLAQVTQLEADIKAYLYEAIEVEKAGIPIPKPKPSDNPLPEELMECFHHDPAFEKAFHALTPGRQRGYILHFSQARQSKTRLARIEKYLPAIMQGKGMQDR